MVRKVTKIYVGNLPESCQNKDLSQLFEKYGKVEECDVIKNYGFVHMSSEEEAKVAIDALNNSEFLGSKITVEVSHSKVRPKPGMGGKGQCYRCGRQGHWSKECPRNPMGNMPPPLTPPFPYAERPMPRYGMDRGYGQPERGFAPERGFGADRTYAGERMRPYPDPYDRRPPPPVSPGVRDDYYWGRRPYDEYGFDRYNYADDRDMVASQGMTSSQYAAAQEMRRDQYESFAGMPTGQQYGSRPQDQFASFPRGMAATPTDVARMAQYDTSAMMDSSFTSRPEIRREDGFNTITTQQYSTAAAAAAYDMKQEPYGSVSSMLTQGERTRDVSAYGGIVGSTPVSQYGSTLMDVKKDYADQFSRLATGVVGAARESTSHTGITLPYGLSATQTADTTKRDYRETMGIAGFGDRTQDVSSYGSVAAAAAAAAAAAQYGSMPIDMKQEYANTLATTASVAAAPQPTAQPSYRMGREEYDQFERMSTQYSNGSTAMNLWREQYARLTGSII